MSGGIASETRPPTIDELDAADAREKLSWFVRHGWSALEAETPLEWSWHHEAICDHVQAALEDWITARRALRTGRAFKQRIKNLLINVPPGSLKSRIVSVYAPAWMWLHCPDWSVLCLSANPDVAIRDSLFCRDLIEGHWYQGWFHPKWKLKKDQDTKTLFANTVGGFRSAKGMNARITGSRADAIFVDDPLDAKDVHSEATREGVNRNWDAAAENRVKDRRIAVRIGIMQRLHERDWSGHVLSKKRPLWEHLCIPTEYDRRRARNDNGDPKQTAIGWFDPRNDNGEVIQPDRVTPEVLAEEREKGDFYWAGQHQQLPAPAGGNIMHREWFRFWRRAGDAEVQPRPDGCWMGPARVLSYEDQEAARQAITLDATFKGSETSDRVAMGCWASIGADRFLVAARWGQMSFVATCEEFANFCNAHPNANEKHVEDKANGTAIIDLLKGLISGLLPWDPGRDDKLARAHASSPQVQAGNVYLPDGVPWLGEFIDEVCGFPRARFDDITDMLTMALLVLRTTSDVEVLLRSLNAR